MGDTTTNTTLALWIAPSGLLVLAGVVGWLWRMLDDLRKAVQELPHQAQQKADEMDKEIKRTIEAMRLEQAAHVQNVNSMHIQNTDRMAKFPTREEVQGVVDRGVNQIIQAIQHEKANH